ncbi:MAG: NAD(P)-binding protein [Actinomycetota bacterium]
MAESIVVGAGLSGLVAAINLAREGRDVLVLERESRVGGSPLYHPSPEGTPVDPAALEAFIGIDISPALHHFEGRAVVSGEVIPTDSEAIRSRLIERGPRSTSLDSLLYSIAVDEGVKFEFGHAIWSNDDVAKLPPDSIIATGLYFEGFDATRVPYLTSFHFVSRQTIADESSSHVTIYHDRFTSDYAYTTSLNGILFAHVFQRRPIGKQTLEAFEEAVFIAEGYEYKAWEHFTFPVPAASIRNPRLFAGDKILAGTLAGYMESYMFFGMLGALVSGKIAAMAVSDKARACEEFRLATRSFAGAYLVKKATNLVPLPLLLPQLKVALRHAFDYPLVTKTVAEAMPGWHNCQRALQGA